MLNLKRLKGENAMPDLEIGYLKLNIENAAGHEHRVEPIARRAVALLAERLNSFRGRDEWPSERMLDAVSASPVDLNLNEMSDEQAAARIARAWTGALTPTFEE